MAVDCFYRQFDVVGFDADGRRIPLANEDVDFYNVTQSTLIDTITTDSYGVIASGGFDSGVDDVALGDIVELRHATYSRTLRFVIAASVEAAYNDPNTVPVYVAEDLATARETPEKFQIKIKDNNDPTGKFIFLGEALLDQLTSFKFDPTNDQDLTVYAVPVVKTAQQGFVEPQQFTSSPLSVPAGSTGIVPLFDHAEDSGCALGSAPTVLYSDTVNGGTLGTNKDKILGEFQLETAANGNEKFVALTIGGHTLVETNPFFDSQAAIEVEFFIIRVSNTTIRTAAQVLISGGDLALFYNQYSGFDLDNNDLDIELIAAADDEDDVVAKMGHALFIPAAPVTYLTSETGDQLTSETGDDLTAE